MKIKRRHLSNALEQWLMSTLQLGPGVGDVFWVAPSDTEYETWAKQQGADSDHLFTSPELAYAATTADRNDVVLVYPGAYDLDAELAWANKNTHLIGLGGPNVWGDWSEPNVCIYTDATSVASVITVTGANCQFHNCNVFQYGNNAACLTAFKLDNYGCSFRNMAFMGVATAGVDDVVAAASLYIDDGGSYPIFENCVIGQNCWDVREGANSGVLRFVGTGGSGPYNGIFRNCQFLSRAETAGVAIVALPANYCMHGIWTFDRCVFSNYWTNWADNLDQVFYDNCGTTHSIVLKDCMAIGCDEWQDADAGNNYISSNMPIVGLGGGLARNPTAGTGS